MSSDSQATGGEWKTLSAKKIHVIKKSKPALVIGYAGNPAYGSYATRQLRKSTEFTIESIEETVGAVYEKFIDRETKRGSNTLGYILAVILQADEVLRIYRVTEEGVGELITGAPYLCIGSGTVWADWLMSEFGQIVLDTSDALQLASYVITMTSLVDPNVGGDFQATRIINAKKLAIAKTVEGEDLEKVTANASDKRRLLRAFWYAIKDKEVKKSMTDQLEPLLKPS